MSQLFECDTCQDCEKAANNPNWPGIYSKCRGCHVRGFANGFEFWCSRRDGSLTPAYRAALQATFGDDWPQAHEAIKAEAGRIHGLRRALQEM
jgi:hypothetical protein